MFNPLPILFTGEELLARPQIYQRGAGGQRHPAHQRSWHPRGVPVRDHVRGAEFDHSGHPHGRAGDHRGGGESVYGSRGGTKVIDNTTSCNLSTQNRLKHPWQTRRVIRVPNRFPMSSLTSVFPSSRLTSAHGFCSYVAPNAGWLWPFQPFDHVWFLHHWATASTQRRKPSAVGVQFKSWRWPGGSGKAAVKATAKTHQD